MSASSELDFLAGLEHDETREASWATFLQRWTPLLLNVGWRFARGSRATGSRATGSRATGSRATDHDQVLDLYLHVCENLAANDCRRLRSFQHGGTGEFAGWLSAVARNLCIDRLRQQRGRRRLPRAIAGLDVVERELFQAIVFDGHGSTEAMERLRAQRPDLATSRLVLALERIQSSVSPRQLSELATTARGAADASPLDDLAQIPDGRADAETELLEREQRDQVRAAVASLDPDDRLLLRLRFEQGLTLAQAGTVLGLKDHRKTHERLTKILDKLRTALAISDHRRDSRKTPRASVPKG